MSFRRVFVIVLDSFGAGALPDAPDFHDEGSDTLRAVMDAGCRAENLAKLGLFNIGGVSYASRAVPSPSASYCKAAERSRGKDTTTGHWEMAGVITSRPFPTYPNGFPQEVLDAFSAATGRGVLCNKPYSGTQVIADYGEEHLRTGSLIVYTSADSVFQIAAHESIVPPEQLYGYCRAARKILTGENAVGRVIARPFAGEKPFYRTPRRHDFSLEPTGLTMCDRVKAKGYESIAVGKIGDIFAHRGFTRELPTVSNTDGMEKTSALIGEDFSGLCFVNLVEFDMLYGHRNDAPGYAKAIDAFDGWLGGILPRLKPDDLLIVTADHGCDPSTPSTDHSREYIPILAYDPNKTEGKDLGVRPTFADLGCTVCDNFGISGADLAGTSFLSQI